jgi:hypothetical protein
MKTDITTQKQLLMDRIVEIAPRFKEIDGTDTVEAWEMAYEIARLLVLLAEEMEVSLTDPTILATGEHFFGLTPIGVAIAANMAKTPVRQVTGRVVQ